MVFQAVCGAQIDGISGCLWSTDRWYFRLSVEHRQTVVETVCGAQLDHCLQAVCEAQLNNSVGCLFETQLATRQWFK